jgi:hypothetical protein
MSRYLTAAAATRLAREAVYGAARFTTTPGNDCFLTRVRMDTLTEEAIKRETTELRLLNLAAEHFRALGYEASVVSTGGTRGKAVRYMVKVVDLRLRADRIEEATQRRHEVMARELGYASVEEYLAAPGRAELIADPELSGYPAPVRTGPSPEVVQRAVARFQEELTANADAIGRILSEPLPGEAGPTPEQAPALAPTVDDDRHALAAGLSFVGLHGGVRTFQVSRGRSSGQRLGRVARVTESLGGGEWVRWAAYREDGSRVGYADSRLAAGQLLLAEADAAVR